MKSFNDLMDSGIEKRLFVFCCDTLTYPAGYPIIKALASDVTCITRGKNNGRDKDQYLFSFSADALPALTDRDVFLHSVIFQADPDRTELLEALTRISLLFHPRKHVVEFRVSSPSVFRNNIWRLSSEKTERLFSACERVFVPIVNHGVFTYQGSSKFTSFRKFDQEKRDD